MTDTILKIIYNVMYAAELFLIGEGIFHNRKKGIAKYAAMAGVYLLVTIPAVLFFHNSAAVILALNMVIYIILFQGTPFSNIIHFTGVYLLVNMAESIVFGIGCILFRPSSVYREISAERSGAFSLFFALVITGFILYIINRKWTQNFILYFHSLNWFQYLIIMIILWSGILLFEIITVMPAYMEHEEKSGMLPAFALVFMGTVFIGIILLVFNVYTKDYYLKQNKIKEEIIRVQQMYFQNIYDSDREMRKFRHDIYAQLRFLGLLLADGKTETALEHLQTIENHFEKLTTQKYHTGSEMLDVILNQKIQDAEKKSVSITFEGKLDAPDFMDTYDLCALFSNMLDNGIEACEAVPAEDAVITVSILTHRNTILFQFTNPATAEMYEALKNGKTTKTDRQNHGFGMENIRRVLLENGGETDYLFRDGTLITDMYFER